MFLIVLGVAAVAAAQEPGRAGENEPAPAADEAEAPAPPDDQEEDAEAAETGADETSDTVLIFDPSEEVSEDLSVAFPADI